MAGKHGPNRLSNYIDVHQNWMIGLQDSGYVISDGLKLSEIGSSIIMEGSVQCRDGLRIDVEKELRILSGDGSDAIVQTVRYGYHAVHEALGNLFRYDSPHREHSRFHHKHIYDALGDQSEVVIEIRSEEEIPTLGQVIEEAVDWFDKHRGQIEAS